MEKKKKTNHWLSPSNIYDTFVQPLLDNPERVLKTVATGVAAHTKNLVAAGFAVYLHQKGREKQARGKTVPSPIGQTPEDDLPTPAEIDEIIQTEVDKTVKKDAEKAAGQGIGDLNAQWREDINRIYQMQVFKGQLLESSIESIERETAANVQIANLEFGIKLQALTNSKARSDQQLDFNEEQADLRLESLIAKRNKMVDDINTAFERGSAAIDAELDRQAQAFEFTFKQTFEQANHAFGKATAEIQNQVTEIQTNLRDSTADTLSEVRAERFQSNQAFQNALRQSGLQDSSVARGDFSEPFDKGELAKRRLDRGLARAEAGGQRALGVAEADRDFAIRQAEQARSFKIQQAEAAAREARDALSYRRERDLSTVGFEFEQGQAAVDQTKRHIDAQRGLEGRIYETQVGAEQAVHDAREQGIRESGAATQAEATVAHYGESVSDLEQARRNIIRDARAANRPVDSSILGEIDRRIKRAKDLALAATPTRPEAAPVGYTPSPTYQNLDERR